MLIMCIKFDNIIIIILATRSLKEQCTAIIISALMEQKSLEPDQLHVRLPHYVPPTVKHYITHIFKMQTMPPSEQETA